MIVSPFVFLALMAVIPPSDAHYNLRDPAPYNIIQCNLPFCKGPCPAIWKSGGAKARNSPKNPSRVWRRGQIVNIEWHRNNHEGGFYRRSLVPVKHMNDKKWHDKLAFEWGCWNQNRFQCGRDPSCGTDKLGNAYRNTMEVPKIFPDGDYVFAMVWYGGIHFRRKRAIFSDYYTCAYVRIQGGEFADAHTPSFKRGRNIRNVAPGKCASTSSFIGQCGGGPCLQNPVRDILPREFDNGRMPPKVLRSFLSGEAGTTSAVQFSPASQEKKAIVADREAAKEDAQMIPQEEKMKPVQVKKGSQGVQPGKWKWPCGSARIPRKTVGTWGVKYSGLWWRQRNVWMKHYNHCRRYKCKC